MKKLMQKNNAPHPIQDAVARYHLISCQGTLSLYFHTFLFNGRARSELIGREPFARTARGLLHRGLTRGFHRPPLSIAMLFRLLLPVTAFMKEL